MALDRFKGDQFPKCIVLQGVYWYCRYPLSYRDIEELMQERGVDVDHSTVQRWVVKHSPTLEHEFRNRRKLAVGRSWRMDETYIKIKGVDYYLYRAVDKSGATIDFLLADKRDAKAARRFLDKAVGSNGEPEKITIDGSAANKSAIEGYNEDNKSKVELRQRKYLNNIIEQDHRGIKRLTRPMLNFKSEASAAATLAGIELVRMLRKNQNRNHRNQPTYQQFYALAA